VDIQAREMENKGISVNQVGGNRGAIPKHYQSNFREKSGRNSCYRCGNEGHFAKDCSVAKDKTCNKCG